MLRALRCGEVFPGAVAAQIEKGPPPPPVTPYPGKGDMGPSGQDTPCVWGARAQGFWFSHFP